MPKRTRPETDSSNDPTEYDKCHECNGATLVIPAGGGDETPCPACKATS